MAWRSLFSESRFSFEAAPNPQTSILLLMSASRAERRSYQGQALKRGHCFKTGGILAEICTLHVAAVLCSPI